MATLKQPVPLYRLKPYLTISTDTLTLDVGKKCPKLHSLLFANHVFDVVTTLPRQHALQSLTFLFRRSFDDILGRRAARRYQQLKALLASSSNVVAPPHSGHGGVGSPYATVPVKMPNTLVQMS